MHQAVAAYDGGAPWASVGPLAAVEAARLREVDDLHILDTPREQEFDRLVFIAAQVLGMRVAAMSILGQDRQWFKARVGTPVAGTSLNLSFCLHALHRPGPLVVPDVRRDPRFQRHPMVTGKPHLRFYAGAPVAGPGGARVGTLCVLDTRPRTLTGAQVTTLAMLAGEASALLARRGCPPAPEPWAAP